MKDSDENGVELKNTETSNGAANDKSEVNKEVTVTWSERILRLVNFFTVEPFLVCYFIPSAIALVAVNQLNMEKACRTYFNYSETICKDVIQGINNDNITIEAREAATVAVTDMLAWQYPLQSSIPAILILFIGAWSDRTGNRKILMMIPLIGEIISVCGLFLATYFFLEWPLWTTALIESLPTALSGGTAVALMGSYSYIADVTTVESRTFRVGVMAVIVTLSFPTGTSLSGILNQEVGYYGVFAIQLVLYIIGLNYIHFRINNVKNEAIEGTFAAKLKSFFNPYNVWNAISLVIVTPLKQRIKVILVICVFVLIMGPVVGEGQLLYSYTLNRYAMSGVDFGLFNTYAILIGTAGTTVAVTLFSKYLKMHDSFIGIIATASKCVSSLVYGLAPNQKWFFAGPAFDFFGNAGVTAIRSIGTKVVDPDKVGQMCSLLGLVEALLAVVYVPLYTKTYNETLHTLPGAVFFLGSAMTIPAFFVFIALFFMHKKEERDVVKDAAVKEKHAYDNHDTAL